MEEGGRKGGRGQGVGIREKETQFVSVRHRLTIRNVESKENSLIKK